MSAMIRRLFTRGYRELVEAVKQDIEMWGELNPGPFNTDPLIEPRLRYLSKNPEYSVVDSVTEGGKISLTVMFWCKATIRCKQYQDHGPDVPLSTTGFAGGVTYEIPVSGVIDVASGEIEEFEVGDIAWQKWANWPSSQTQ
jgi:hypothetical protein